jgi:hypothetical protein
MDAGRQLLEGKGEIKAQPNLCGEGSGTHGRSGVGLVVLLISSMKAVRGYENRGKRTKR